MKKEKEQFLSGIPLFGAATYSVAISSYSKPSSDATSEQYLHVNTYFTLFYFIYYKRCGLFTYEFEVTVCSDFKKFCLINNLKLFLICMRRML